MKKVISAILALALCASVAVAASGCGCQKSGGNPVTSNSSGPGYNIEPTNPDLAEGDFSFYRLNDKEVKVTVYKGTSKNVEIPAAVGGAKVTVIEANLFQNSDIESVKIPASITEIQKYAFAGCQNLKEVVIPEGVKVIGVNAFWNCKNLKKITLPTTLEKVEWTAFSATGIQSITIPESSTFTTLTDKLFFQCHNLKEVTIPVTITKIADDTFSECAKDLTIKAYAGSYAASYASGHKFKLSEMARDGGSQQDGGETPQEEADYE